MAEQRDDGHDQDAGAGHDDGGLDHGGPDRSRPDHGGPGAGTHDPSVAGLGYEQARDELVEVVRRLEAGGAGLEESLALWERGEELARICQDWLDGARARLDAALGSDGSAGPPPQVEPPARDRDEPPPE